MEWYIRILGGGEERLGRRTLIRAVGTQTRGVHKNKAMRI